MTKWSRTLAVIMTLFLVLTAVGCSSGSSSEPKTTDPAPTANEPAKAPDPVTLNMWIMPNSSQSEQDMLDTFKPFLDKNKHITIKVTVLDWGSAWTKITAAATSGEGPDLLQLGTTWVPAIAAMDALEPLSSKVQEVGGKDAFFPASWNTASIAGQTEVYALPWFMDVRAAYYRTDVFQKAGVDPKEAFKDWDSFRKALEKLNGTEIEGKKMAAIGFPGKNDWNVLHNVMPWVWGAGGAELTSDNKASAINTEAAVDGMMFYTSLAKDGLAPMAVLEKNSADVEQMFHVGDFAVTFAGPWLIRHYYTPADKNGGADTTTAKNYAVAPVPMGPKGRFTFFGGSNLAIMKSSKHKAEAWEALKFLQSKEAQLEYAKLSGMLPAQRSVEADMKAVNPNYGAFYDAAKDGRSYASIPQWGAIEGVYVKHIATIWDMATGVSGTYNRAEVKKVLDEAAKEATNLLKQ